MISERQIDKLPSNEARLTALCEDLGLDRLSAWRYLRDQEILRRRYRYQAPGRYQGEGDISNATEERKNRLV